MIWKNFRNVQSKYEDAQCHLNYLRLEAIDYIKAVAEALGSVGVTLPGNIPAIMSHDASKEPIIYRKIGKGDSIEAFDTMCLYGLAKQLHEAHLDKEWGEPDKEEPTPEDGALNKKED